MRYPGTNHRKTLPPPGRQDDARPIPALAADSRVLLLFCRNLGDTVIGTSLVNSLGESFPGITLEVLTRPGFAPVFAGNPYVSALHFASFPMGTRKEFGPREAFRLLAELGRLRKRRADICINNAGDFRENLVGWLTGPATNCSVSWPQAHPIRRLVRPGLERLVNASVPVPETCVSVYAVQNQIAHSLGCTRTVSSRLYSALPSEGPTAKVIGLHPTSTQPWKEWLPDRWAHLASELAARGWQLWIFGAGFEREKLATWFAPVLSSGHAVLKAGSLGGFFSDLAGVRLLVGLDSLSVHAAHALGVPAVLLNGANDARAWAPPSALVLGSGACPLYPCHSRPTCTKPGLYACIRDITVPQVLAAIEQQLTAAVS